MLKNDRYKNVLDKAVIIITLGLVFYLALSEFTFFDIWMHLRVGKSIVQLKAIPREDIYSYTASLPWINGWWLSQAIFYLLYSGIGSISLSLLKSLIIVIIFAIVLKILLDSKVNLYLACLIIILSAYIGRRGWVVRPQIFTYLFSSISYYILYKYRIEGKSPIWMIPLLMIFWINLHPGFAIGIVLVLIFAIGGFLDSYFKGKILPLEERESSDINNEKAIFLTKIALIAILACLINPYTYHSVILPFMHLEQTTTGLAGVEWASPKFNLSSTRPFEFMILLTIISMVLSGKRVSFIDIGNFIVMLHISLTSFRNIPLFVIIVSPILAKYLLSASEELRLKERLRVLTSDLAFRVVVILLLGIYLVYSFITFTDPLRNPFIQDINDEMFEGARYPKKAIDFIEDNKLPQRLFNTYSWGGYTLWRLYSEYKIFIDGRTPVYSLEVLEDYAKIQGATYGFEEILKKYGINTILVPTVLTLAYVLDESPASILIYSDQSASVFISNSSQNREIIDKYPEVKLAIPSYSEIKIRGYVSKAIEAYRKGNKEEAIEYYGKILTLDSENILALYSLGIIYEEQGEIEEARRKFGMVIELAPESDLGKEAQKKLESGK